MSGNNDEILEELRTISHKLEEVKCTNNAIKTMLLAIGVGLVGFAITFAIFKSITLSLWVFVVGVGLTELESWCNR